MQVSARIEPFIDDMAAAYAWADLVICRSGALTLAELCAVGVASVLVPFPHAVDDHQTRNAEFLSEHAAAVLVPRSPDLARHRSEEHTSELQSLMRISYAVFCLKKKNTKRM